MTSTGDAAARAEAYFRDTLDADLRREAVIGFVVIVVIFVVGFFIGRASRPRPPAPAA